MDTHTVENGKANIAHNAAELRQMLDREKHSHVKLGQFLLQGEKIDPETLNKALHNQYVHPQKKLGEVLAEMGVLTAEQVREATFAQLELPTVYLDGFNFDQSAIAMLPREIAHKHHLMPLLMHKGSLVIATDTLPSAEALSLLRFTVKKPVDLVMSTKEEIDHAISFNYHLLNDMHDLTGLELAAYEDHEESLVWQEAEHLARRQPIVKLVQALIQDAVNQRASDIHIRPNERSFSILYRVDGTLIHIREFDKSYLPAVISRIKILSSLNIAERRLPQDGRIHFQDEDKKIDLRVSTIPMQFGESVVIRILNKNIGMRTIHEIGFKAEDEEKFNDLLKRSYGIILVTGPTGSGKSTTLYAALKAMENENVNIITVEDPIEYELHNGRQIQLSPAIDFGFPEALRHILRHDPDVIMIGEMRDLETCKIAVESALTGHLVLSTLHTNDAPSALVRLMEIGVEPYMIRSAVIGVLAQRLVRCNCEHCLIEEAIDPLTRKNLGISDDEKFYRGAGCRQCHNTGFLGRVAIYELMMMNDQLRAAIGPGVSSGEYRALAIQAGMTPLSVNGVEYARSGKVSIAEIYRAFM